MPRSQIVVNVAAAMPRRGNDSLTGITMLVYAGATGNLNPVRCRTAADATASGAPVGVVSYVQDALAQGSPQVVLVRAAAANVSAVTEAEWNAGLAKLTDDFGGGVVIIPGVSTTAAYNALMAHAAARPDRTVLLDSPTTPVAATLVTTATSFAAAAGAARATIVTPVTLTGPAGTTRDVPGSVIVAGLVGRNDSYNGHANNAPIRDGGRGAGFVRDAVSVPVRFTDAEIDSLADAGVSVIQPIRDIIQLLEWRALSSDARFKQLNWGRSIAELTTGLSLRVEKFLGRQIDGQGRLYAELDGVLRGYLTDLWRRDALSGDTAADAFDVQVSSVNNATTAAAGELRAAAEVRLSAHTQRITFDIVTYTNQG